VVHTIDIIVCAIALLDLIFKSIEYMIQSKQKKLRHKRFLEMIQ
jgi:phospholipid N-methyltransferase